MKKLILMAVFTTIAFGQYNDGNTVVTWSRYKWEPLSKLEGISLEDRAADVTEFHTKRNKVARKLLGSTMLTHYWSGSVLDVEILGEFKNMNDATDYAGFNNINQLAWNNPEERAAAVSNYNRHFQAYHEDVHIFENWVALEKKRTVEVTGEETFFSGPVVTVSVRYWKRMSDVEGGSAEERLKLMKKVAKEVVGKNPKILSQKVLTHLWSGSIEGGALPVVFLTEYASIADADDPGNAEYWEASFSEEEVQNYNKYFHWLIDKHDDLGLFRTFEPAGKNK